MPKLWTETIEAHRREVRDAIVDTTAALVAERGIRAVTMSEIAERTGIGRATLYKYFPGVDAILGAWHERQISGHLEQLAAIAAGAGDATDRLRGVLEAYAFISFQRPRTDLASVLHRGQHVERAERELSELVRRLMTEAADVGEIRRDVAPDELATYCLHALAAAAGMSSKAAVRRLVSVTLGGLRPPTDRG